MIANVICIMPKKNMISLPDHCPTDVNRPSSTSTAINSLLDITSCASVCIQNDARYCVAHRHCIRRA